VAIFALSIVAFMMNLTRIDIAGLSERLTPSFPRRVFAWYMIVLAGMLIILWLGRIIPMLITKQFPAELAGLGTLEPQALDLGLIVPLSLAGGILLLRRSKWGYLLAGIGITHGFMMFLTIPVWIVVPLVQKGTINVIEASPFLALCLIGIILAAWFYKSLPGSPRA
jgi:hypothetical protein